MSNDKWRFRAYDYFDFSHKDLPAKIGGYCDYHNHLGGVLPYQELYRLYNKHYSKTLKAYGEEWKDLTGAGAADGSNRFKSEIGLFLRTTYQLFCDKKKSYKFVEKQAAPMRGAHVAMLGVFYLFLFAAKVRIISKQTINSRDEISDLLKEYLRRCYVLHVSGEKVPVDCVKVAKRAFRNYVRATRYSPFDDGYVGRSAYLRLFDKAFGTNDYGKYALEWLWKEENTRYVEMSQPLSKIPAVAGDKKYEWCKWLLLSADHREYLAGEDNWNQQHWHTLVDALIKRKTYIGIDLAGPEGYRYLPDQTRKLVRFTLFKLRDKARQLKRNLTFRPHVGEGSSIVHLGPSLIEADPVAFVNDAMKYAFDNRNSRVKGVTSGFFDWLDRKHPNKRSFKVYKNQNLDDYVKAMSINNIDVFIDALEAVGYPEKFPNIIVRFGHVTHVTKDQAERMAKLDIHADVNLGSNLRTGSMTFLENLQDAKSRRAVFHDWNRDWSSLVDRGHGLINLLNAGVMVALGSDGQGAEETRMYSEYHLAEEYLKDHKIGNHWNKEKLNGYCKQLLTNAIMMRR